VDLKSPAGVGRLRELAAQAAILLETNRPGVMERLGVGPEALRVEDVRRTGKEPYRYEREVEDFLRYSPSVKANARREPKRKNVARGEGRRALPQETRG